MKQAERFTRRCMNQLTRRAHDGTPEPEPLMKCVSLVVRAQKRVTDLSGYRKTFSVPDQVNDRTQAFVEKLGAAEVRTDLDAMFTAIRSAFRFKRAELLANEFGAGGGTLKCPFFSYTSYVEQHPHEASEAVWHRLISDITEPAQLLTDSFASVFHDVFDTVELVPPSPIDLELLIDRIEDVDNDLVSLDYDRNVTHCAILIEGSDVKIDVTPRALRIVHPEPTAPALLVESLFEVQKALVDFSSFDT